MNALALQVCGLASAQHDVIATWQLRAMGWSRGQIREALREFRRVFRGVCAIGDLTELGWFMAAALSMGPTGRISHLSALQLMELRRFTAGDIHVSHAGGGRTQREGLTLHRRTSDERWEYKNVPCVRPTRALAEADLKPHELYRALDIAQRRGIVVDDQTLPLKDVVRLRSAVEGLTKRNDRTSTPTATAASYTAPAATRSCASRPTTSTTSRS